jgi:hypothetical protein
VGKVFESGIYTGLEEDKTLVQLDTSFAKAGDLMQFSSIQRLI